MRFPEDYGDLLDQLSDRNQLKHFAFSRSQLKEPRPLGDYLRNPTRRNRCFWPVQVALETTILPTLPARKEKGC
jgi:hypothetical protein